jgi:hypothetical protein
MYPVLPRLKVARHQPVLRLTFMEGPFGPLGIPAAGAGTTAPPAAAQPLVAYGSRAVSL